MDIYQQLFQILMIYFLTKRCADGMTTLSAGRKIAEGVPYSLVCTESSAITNNVFFFKNDVNKGGCVSSTCDTSVAGYSVTQTTTSTTLHIDSVDGTREEGNWTCQHGTDPKSSLFVIALPIPTYLNESAITTDPTEGSSISPPQVIVVSIPCANPLANVTWSYTKNSNTKSISASDSTNCLSGQNMMNSSLNTGDIADTGLVALKVKVEHDSFNPSNNYAKLFTFEVNLGATTTPSTPDTSQSTDSSTSQTTSDSSSSPTSVENEITEASDESPFACESNCVEETRRLYLSVFLPVLILVAIDVVVLVSVVCNNRRQNKTA